MLDAGTFNERPNVVLLHCATNDLHQEPPRLPYEGAPQRLETLIDIVFEHCPDTVLLVATIVNDDSAQARIDAYNAKIPHIVADRVKRGAKIRLVDQSVVGGDDLAEGLHPNDAGYLRMARIWFRALQTLPSGWITSPLSVNTTSSDDDG